MRTVRLFVVCLLVSAYASGQVTGDLSNPIPAVTEDILHRFGDNKNGASPFGGLIADSRGILYGTTNGGGTYQAGVVFATDPAAGKYRVLYSFCALPACADGLQPRGNLTLDSAGNLYGTTLNGGAYGGGVVFELVRRTNGAFDETTLYSFSGVADGVFPNGGLVLDAAGNIYGSTYYGGSGTCNDGIPGCGVIFQLNNNGGVWTETVLHNFTGQPDGQYPSGGVAADAVGNIYGTTYAGGEYAAGTVFQLTPGPGNGWTTNTIYSFCPATPNCGDGDVAYSGVVVDRKGNLFGTTVGGGQDNQGTIFELTQPAGGIWTEEVVYSFCSGNCSDGAQPWGGLILDGFGNLYGTTAYGGATGTCCGVVFELSRHHVYSSFALPGDESGGYSPQETMAISKGRLFGTTPYGGFTDGLGVLFEILP